MLLSFNRNIFEIPVTIQNHAGMTGRVMPRMNSDGYFCVVLIADVRHMSKNRCLWQRFCEWDGRVLNSYKYRKNKKITEV